ncbi:hypothetical protein IQ260_24920 [Leptolyngbya cf. ectocarpi LEGE 11479]|uniref:Uncharacterized protein n=1 Tax=Leptolyngbya cf. ectocarpi LEGE 11479 TaxID=1828722 RepID=A0A928ZYU5_LEPEC|nr:hypothetical protein [Leptolyngbya ectocarpi]MBE9069888.1 hypothetical protein [Leptolyngbya cf. ectocarpi LEGE 11479]
MMTENSPSAYDGGQSLQPAKSATRSHLRLTPEAVHQNWLDHFYSPAGYLYHLILAFRKQGWWFRIEDDPDFFAFVVKHKIPRLPDPPASKQSAAQGWIRKYGDRLYTEYLQWLESQRQVEQRLTPIPPNEETPDQRLQRYQMLWQNPTCRKGVRTAIQTHPEWHLEIGPNGPRTQPPAPQAP